MDQRAKGGPPSPTYPPLPPTTPPEHTEKEAGGGRSRRSEGEKGGAVLEVHIEGRCGGSGKRQLQCPDRESNCPEGNVRFRIGLQAKRTKKPPKILESYVCKPAIRTYQRPGRGDGEGGGDKQGKTTPPPQEGDREQRQGLDLHTTETNQMPSSPLPPSSSSSSSLSPLPSSSSSSTAPTSTTSTPGNPGPMPAKRVPPKLAHKKGGKSDVPSERLIPLNLPNANSKLPPPGTKHPSPQAQTIPSAPSPHPPSIECMDPPHPPNGMAQTERGSAVTCESTLQPSVDNKREKEERMNKEKAKDEKARQDRVKGERLSEGSTKKRKGKDGKSKDDRGKVGRVRDERRKDETGRDEKERNSKPSPELHRGTAYNGKPDEMDKPGETDDTAKLEEPGERCKLGNTGKPDEMAESGDSGKLGEPPAPGGTSKLDKIDTLSRVTLCPSNPSATSPPPPSLAIHSPSSAPTSPPQDSRPLKKRKARRLSWTKLVNRAQRLAENQDTPLDSPLISTTPATNISNQQTAEPHQVPCPSSPPSPSSISTQTKPRPVRRPPSPIWIHMLKSDPKHLSASERPNAQARKRGRPKAKTSSIDDPPANHSSKPIPPGLLPPGCDRAQDPPVLDPVLDLSPTLPNPNPFNPNPTPRKRGRPKRLPSSPPQTPQTPTQDQRGDALTPPEGKKGCEDQQPEKGNRQLKMRRIIDEMKKRKRRRLPREMLSGRGGGGERGGEADGETSCEGVGQVCRPTLAVTHSLSALSSTFGGKLGPQVNVSKRGTIYMGKRRGRKPKSPSANHCSISTPASQSALFTSPPGASLFSSPQPQSQPPFSHPFPSPSLTHSSGAQSPYSDGSFTEPTSSLFSPHSFSLPSPSSSCASPRPLSTSFSSPASMSPSLKRNCPCQGRHHFPFHHPSCKLSSPAPHMSPPPPRHHPPVSPAHMKEATPSPVSESHSEETLPSDSGIGTDNNSISEQGERRGGRGGGVALRMTSEVPRSGVSLGGQRQRDPTCVLLDHPSPFSSPLSPIQRHTPPVTAPAALVGHRERHRHRRRYDCVSPGPCPCPGHSKRSHLDICPCLGHNALKRQKHKRKRKYQQLLMRKHDLDFLSELEDLIGQFSEVRIGRRDWGRAGPGQGFDGSGNAIGGERRLSSLSHHFRSNLFRINLSGYYSPHPPYSPHPSSYPSHPYSPHPSFSPHHLHPCHPSVCGRKTDRRQCGCPTKFQEGGEEVGYYRGYPSARELYPHPHLHPSFPLPPPHLYAHPQHLHPPHLLLNPARFHRRRSRLLREGGVGVEGEEESRDGVCLDSGSSPSLSCGCVRSEHKHRHRHHERDQGGEEEEKEGMTRSKSRSEFTAGTGEGRSRGVRGTGNVWSMESPWGRKTEKDASSSATVNPPTAPSSSSSSPSSSSGERLKHTHMPLTCLGLGSSHLSRFGGGWGGQGLPCPKKSGLGEGGGGGHSTAMLKAFTGGQQTGTVGTPEREETHTPLYSPSVPLTHTNLFTMATGGRGLRSGGANGGPGRPDWSQRREESSWTERRGSAPVAALWAAGSLSDPSRRQQRQGRTGSNVGKRRGPGRPRKQPLPSPIPSPVVSPIPSPTHSPMGFLLPSSNTLPASPTEEHVQKRDCGGERGEGGDTVQEVIEAVVQGRRSRGRKRRGAESPCLLSSGEGRPMSHTSLLCMGQTELSQPPPPTLTIQLDERADRPPRKKFQKAGLYSDDYKTTDPPPQPQQPSTENLEYTPGEHQHSLLPAPINVGKYLRLKRIDFQLPYDVVWLWKHNQLHKESEVPLNRKRPSCQPKEITTSSPQALDECSGGGTKLFPHLDMKPLTSSERGFVLRHHVFLVRNWELVRQRQIQLRTEREGEQEKDRDVCCDGADGNDSYIKSGQPMGLKEKVVPTSDLLYKTQCTPTPLCPRPHLTKPQTRRKEEEQREEEVNRRKVQRERLNILLLKLQHE